MPDAAIGRRRGRHPVDRSRLRSGARDRLRDLRAGGDRAVLRPDRDPIRRGAGRVPAVRLLGARLRRRDRRAGARRPDVPGRGDGRDHDRAGRRAGGGHREPAGPGRLPLGIGLVDLRERLPVHPPDPPVRRPVVAAGERRDRASCDVAALRWDQGVGHGAPGELTSSAETCACASRAGRSRRSSPGPAPSPWCSGWSTTSRCRASRRGRGRPTSSSARCSSALRGRSGATSSARASSPGVWAFCSLVLVVMLAIVFLQQPSPANLAYIVAVMTAFGPLTHAWAALLGGRRRHARRGRRRPSPRPQGSRSRTARSSAWPACSSARSCCACA